MQTSHSGVDRFLRVAARLLIGVVWLSATLFGLYILLFYFAALLLDKTEVWNAILPGLFDTSTRTATLGIGLHFAAGGIILVLGCIQLIAGIRRRYPAVHRWLGRVYVLAALLTAVGGLVFIVLKGTIGGVVMNVAFALYGILMLGAAVQTIRYARAGRYDDHRAWAIRLFALAIGSWLYRMDYGFWFLFTDGLGHNGTFTGPFDYFMDFWFYLPNLLVAEVFIGRKAILQTKGAKISAAVLLYAATAFLVLATYYFTIKLWWPKVVEVIG